jgi:hypothetical protein
MAGNKKSIKRISITDFDTVEKIQAEMLWLAVRPDVREFQALNYKLQTFPGYQVYQCTPQLRKEFNSRVCLEMDLNNTVED